jgi:hypothetical protein
MRALRSQFLAFCKRKCNCNHRDLEKLLENAAYLLRVACVAAYGACSSAYCESHAHGRNLHKWSGSGLDILPMDANDGRFSRILFDSPFASYSVLFVGYAPLWGCLCSMAKLLASS